MDISKYTRFHRINPFPSILPNLETIYLYVMNCSQLTFSLELVSVQSFVTCSKQNHEVEQVLAS